MCLMFSSMGFFTLLVLWANGLDPQLAQIRVAITFGRTGSIYTVEDQAPQLDLLAD